MERRLAAMLISDVVRCANEDTKRTVAAWSEARDKVLKPSVASKDSRIAEL